MSIEVQAITYDEFGGPEVLKVGKRNIPAIGENDVLIKVEWAGVNRADLMQRQGRYPNQKAPMHLGKILTTDEY